MGLNTDGSLLLPFRYLILSDPLKVLQSWNLVDQSPCSWNGVACDSIDGCLRVTGLSLPVSLFNSIKLRFLDLSNNLISGGIPDTVGTLQNLQFLNPGFRLAKCDCPSPSPTSSPAMAAIPKTPDTGSKKLQQNKFKPVKIVAIIVVDIAGIVLVIMEEQEHDKKGKLVTVDGEKKLDLDTLLKASEYILGATGSNIMYKAVQDGSSLAVRRIGENTMDRFKDFENQPGQRSYRNNRKVGSSPCHLPWETRLKIAKGMARGLVYLHEKKHVHANLKPSNILLDSKMEPKIGDFGLERLVTGDMSSKIEISLAQESLRSIKPNPKWDVYAFGVILLDLLTGKVVVVDELGQGNGVVVEDQNKALRMAGAAILGDLECKEDALVACFKLGYNCASPIPQKRPTMKKPYKFFTESHLPQTTMDTDKILECPWQGQELKNVQLSHQHSPSNPKTSGSVLTSAAAAVAITLESAKDALSRN
ncbi:putative LRR receptor-like serine/threonine-protein kinase [Hibiscus syriacus]|uniref:non-specific serine/threonine protein kinase n=1 Tax=Hibiscus syriacus TaxID=106335 RepID=A0A6A2ZVJ9_HIBSY|nr:putative LRR receptor-like serine/threonine-protein kinase [Hibiscus syriacus]